jgi:hypothetical protein
MRLFISEISTITLVLNISYDGSADAITRFLASLENFYRNRSFSVNISESSASRNTQLSRDLTLIFNFSEAINSNQETRVVFSMIDFNDQSNVRINRIFYLDNGVLLESNL